MNVRTGNNREFMTTNIERMFSKATTADVLD